MDGCIYRTADNKCEFWSDHGKGIVSYCDFEDCNEKKLSNADRIRSMNDEELAEWMGNIQYDTAYYCAGECKQKYPYPDGWLDWLKQEVNHEV